MSDVRHILVTLEVDTHGERAEAICNAIRMIKGVATVEEREVTAADYMARHSARIDLQVKISEFLRGLFKD